MMVAALQIIRHGKTISVCHFPALAAPRGGPRFFALIVEIILVRKSRKTPCSRPPLAGRVSFFLLDDSFSSLPQCRRYESEYA